MSLKFKIGIIGAGMWGKTHIAMFQSDPRSIVRWVCDPDPAALESIRQEFGVEHLAQNYEEMLIDPKVDAVVVASPPFTHVGIGLAVLKSGKHLLIEKPMAIHPEEAKMFVKEAENHPDLVILEGSCRHTRLNPKFDFVKSIIDSGKLGEIYHIHHTHLSPQTFIEYNPQGKWAMAKRWSGGGPFMDWGEYDLSFHLGILGDRPAFKSTRAFTIGGLRELSHLAPLVDVEMHGAAWLEFDHGLTYYYERGSGVHGETRCETRIQGTKGGLHFYYPTWESNLITYYYSDDHPQKKEFLIDMANHPPHDNILLVSHFLNCLEGNEQPEMPISLADKHLGILFKILDCANADFKKDGIEHSVVDAS